MNLEKLKSFAANKVHPVTVQALGGTTFWIRELGADRLWSADAAVWNLEKNCRDPKLGNYQVQLVARALCREDGDPIGKDLKEVIAAVGELPHKAVDEIFAAVIEKNGQLGDLEAAKGN